MKKKDHSLLFIFITIFIDITGLGIIIPVIPALITELINGSISDAAKYSGWLMFSYATLQFLFAPFLGGLSDQFGRRPVILLSLFGFGINYLVLALAPNITWLFLGRIFQGIMGASLTTASAYIADISTPEKKAQNFGLIGAAFGLGFILGPVIGGYLGQFGSRVPFIAAAAFSLINLIYGYFILPESLDKKNRRKFDIRRANPVGTLMSLKRYPIISGLLICIVLFNIAQHATHSTWTFFTIEKFDWSEKLVGYSLGFIGLLAAIVQGGLIRIIIPRLGNVKSVYFGMIFYILGLSLFSFAEEGWMVFAFAIPLSLGGISGPALQGIMTNKIPDDEQGEFQGGLTSLVSLTAIIGPLLMTNLFSYFTSENTFYYFPGAPFMVAAIISFFGLIIAIRFLSSSKEASDM
ncbi:MAG: TCR/Tet family MFS transporter [Bacteroidota bacterium]|nr:TCR/Tet family MFS transporter [Bacteroidota bacterium]|tara:strand:- start:2361 stop:3584 length:1224 start_codon:yes stop_codon:yes gene_type:complete